MGAKFRSLPDLEKNLTKNAITGCHIWSGRYVTKDGNTEIPWHGKNRLVHRLIYEFAHGPVPAHAYVLRTCKNNQCCNPAHMGLRHCLVGKKEVAVPALAPAPTVEVPVIVKEKKVKAENDAKTIVLDFGTVKVTISR